MDRVSVTLFFHCLHCQHVSFSNNGESTAALQLPRLHYPRFWLGVTENPQGVSRPHKGCQYARAPHQELSQ
eukprot:1759681-Amphidinium_carterae.1